MLKKVFRFLFSVCLIVLGIGMSLYPAVRSEKIHMEAISYQKEVDNAYKQNKEQKKKKEEQMVLLNQMAIGIFLNQNINHIER